MDSNEFFKFKEGTKEVVAEGGLCVVEKILYFLFKSPFAIWRMSCKHLKELRQEAKLDIEKIDGPLPFIVFLIRYFFDFLLHALIFISVAIAPIMAVLMTIKGVIDYHDTYSFAKFFTDFFGTFAAFYYAPLAYRLTIEILVLIKKYGIVILRAIFFPAIILYYFCYYLAKKCKFKTAKYEKKFIDINREEPMNL